MFESRKNTNCISGQPEQIKKLKKMAAQEEKTVSAFIFEKTDVMK